MKRTFQKTKRTIRMTLKEAYRRGYRAAKRQRLNEAQTSMGLWDIITKELESWFRQYNGDIEGLIDDLLDIELGDDKFSNRFSANIERWYDTLGDKYGMEDDVLSQIDGAVNAWVLRHRNAFVKSGCNSATIQDLNGSLYNHFLREIAVITHDHDLLLTADLDLDV